mmetsp:Transcript_7776/g.13669  ORF Transcript_7776/g.13669 Transcript_7776/m.13669 type:complete len:128 (-) Transcript_7776:23539-23922(-)
MARKLTSTAAHNSVNLALSDCLVGLTMIAGSVYFATQFRRFVTLNHAATVFKMGARRIQIAAGQSVLLVTRSAPRRVLLIPIVPPRCVVPLVFALHRPVAMRSGMAKRQLLIAVAPFAPRARMAMRA